MIPSTFSSSIRHNSVATRRTPTFASALYGGGVLWIAHYALQIAMGLHDGTVHMNTPIGLLDGLCFSGAIIGLCSGLFGLVHYLATRRSALGRVSQAFASIAAICIVIGFFIAVLHHRSTGMWGGIGVIGSCLSATFAALTAKRHQALPAHLTNSLLSIGLLTFPVIVAFAWPADKWIPAFYTDELPFALSGSAYMMFARQLRRSSS